MSMSMSNDDDTMTVSTKAKKRIFGRMSVCPSVRLSHLRRLEGSAEQTSDKKLLPVPRTLYQYVFLFIFKKFVLWRVECCDTDVTQNIGVDVRCDAMSARH